MWGPYYGVFLIEAKKLKENTMKKKIVSSADESLKK